MPFIRRFFLWCILIGLLLVGYPGQSGQGIFTNEGSTILFGDIYWQEQTDRLVFGNTRLTLEIDKSNGQWLSFMAKGVTTSMIASTDKRLGFDFLINNQPLIEKYGAKVLVYRTHVDRMRNGASLEVTFEVDPSKVDQKNGDRYEVTCIYTLFPGEGRLERSARVNRKGGKDTLFPQHFDGFVFNIPYVTLGPAKESVIDVPGPFFPKTYVAPATPYDSLTGQSMAFHSAPDAGFGVLTLRNPRLKKTLISWMNTAGETNYRPSLLGEGKRLTFNFVNYRAYYLPVYATVESDVHTTKIVEGDLPVALEKYRRTIAQTMPLDAKTDAWVKKMVVLEVYPKYFKGGVNGLTEKLPFYKEIGFNTIYLMPHWKGGYFPLDLYAVDPSVGTTEDLKTMVETAHRLGMKVLFDMVIHGFSPESTVVKERPELFVHDEKGKPALHPTWKSVSTDWANPLYQQYMVQLVQHDLQTYGIDGYRVDAASYKGPGWDTTTHEPPYRSGTAAPELLRKMLSSMREIKPEATMLSEVFGPVFLSVSNLGHDNQTEAPQVLLEKMAKGGIKAKDYQAHLANVFDLLPQGANRVFFGRNHDTSWFYHFGGYTPRFMAMEAVHALFTIPEVFAGDPDHGPHPDTDPLVYQYYGKLFALRVDFPEFADGERLLRAVQTNNPWVISGIRQTAEHTSLAVVSFSNNPEKVRVSLSTSIGAAGNRSLQMLDVLSAETKEITLSGNAMELTLKPYQVVVVRLR